MIHPGFIYVCVFYFYKCAPVQWPRTTGVKEIETECSEKKKKKTVHDYRAHEILASVETRSMGGKNGLEARPPGLVPESIPNLYQHARSQYICLDQVITYL